MFSNIAYAMGTTQQQAGGESTGNVAMQFLPIVLILVVFYFMLIRPQQKRAKQHREMVAAMKVGDPVVTNAGIYGRILSMDGDMVEVDLGETKVYMMRGALSVLPANQKSPVPAVKKGKKKNADAQQDEADGEADE